MNGVTYPLGHDMAELNRLDSQATLLQDPFLEELAAKARTCLEIGCGNGSNFPLIRQANKHLKYVGIDLSTNAVAEAQSRYGDDGNAAFAVMNATQIDLVPASFDLIFTKLVLWSIGPAWSEVLKEARRLLKPGGTFYAFEPCNHLVELYPEKPAAKSWMNAWDQAALKSGIDPFIGTKVAGEMKKHHYQQVDSKFFPVIANGREKDRYLQIVENLQGFYLGAAVTSLGLQYPEETKEQARTELAQLTPESLVMDAFFISWGVKA
jgi:ubiquinone/menaquinone biosynthesis C-methylase UbiE